MFAKSLLMFTLGLIQSTEANDFAYHKMYMQQLLEQTGDVVSNPVEEKEDTLNMHTTVHHAYDAHAAHPTVDHGWHHPEEF